MQTIVALSWFHRKIGPMVFYSYPEGTLEKTLSDRIASIMDQTVNEGMFSHSFENRFSMNYYFEIHSDWARGSNEMLMASIIFNRQIPREMEPIIHTLCTEFADKLRKNEDIYTAFHIHEMKYHEGEEDLIVKNHTLITGWIEDLYWATLEETRERTEEEKIAALLTQEHIFFTLKKLSKGPITLEGLRDWFHSEFPKFRFKDLMDTLVDKQFIFINQIGLVEKYVLLLKEVNAERIPPDSVIEYLDEASEQVESELTNELLPIVLEYFSEHEMKNPEDLEKDSFNLFQIVSDRRKYGILTVLRKGMSKKERLPNIISKQIVNHLENSLDFLKQHDVVEEMEHENKTYLLLKSDIQIKTAFPEYLRKLLPKEEEKEPDRIF